MIPLPIAAWWYPYPPLHNGASYPLLQDIVSWGPLQICAAGAFFAISMYHTPQKIISRKLGTLRLIFLYSSLEGERHKSYSKRIKVARLISRFNMSLQSLKNNAALSFRKRKTYLRWSFFSYNTCTKYSVCLRDPTWKFNLATLVIDLFCGWKYQINLKFQGYRIEYDNTRHNGNIFCENIL